MTVNSAQLLKDLRAELGPLVDDLRARCDEHPEVDAVVRAEWDEARSRGRTSRSYVVWRDDHLTNVAVAWLLALVFVRFCEDNDLVSPPLLGGSDDRRDVARGHRHLYFSEHPGHGDREWLLDVFQRSRRLPGLADVLGAHNPLWSVGPTADGARRLIEFWEKVDPASGEVRHDFTDDELDTRFLGDLYQDLSDAAKKQYALLQTPIFVEEFILDRTLDPAIAEFGLDDVSLIDPTCGSGHFLLGAFDRLSTLFADRHAGEPPQVIAQRALHAIAGVDLNPAAAAIARFRLLVAALKVCRAKRLADLPAFELNVAVGDSLLHGRIPGQTLDIAGADAIGLRHHAYSTEDVEQAKKILFRRYSAVVGNPPYITVKDSAMNAAYRAMFGSCHRSYSLAVPFFERFFDLATVGDAARHAGFVGMITANSFMKQEFGRKLIETFMPTWDLTHMIDASGAYIPGHGTPTVIIFGRQRYPTTPTVRGVLGRRGEPGRSSDPAKGVVWNSITSLIDTPAAEDAFVTVTDLYRTELGQHPWNIGGGGAAELKTRLGLNRSDLGRRIEAPIGRAVRVGADELFEMNAVQRRHSRAEADELRLYLTGEDVRDWSGIPLTQIWYPYGRAVRCFAAERWPWRTTLQERRTFQGNMADAGLKWWDYMQYTASAYKTPLSITFANVATHNQFALDCGGSVFNAHAPVIKLPELATRDEHLALLALLNSSTACFWMQQVFHNKGAGGGARVDQGYAARGDEGFHDHYEMGGTKLQQLPVPAGSLPLRYGQSLDGLATERTALTPHAVADRTTPTRDGLASARLNSERLTRQMIAAQEELDWYVYGLYGLVDEDFTVPLDDVPPVQLGERAFEIVMARQIEAGDLETTWFVRHGSTPITEIPAHWTEAYRELVARRIEKIESDRDIALIERPECKRRWASESWDSQVERALRRWLLDRLEAPAFWSGHQILSTRALAELARRDPDFVSVAELYRGHDVDIVTLVTELVGAEAVPFVAAWRYTADGMRVRAEWERTWDLQRREDAREDVGVIPVPPKYGRTDFAKPSYWPLRGKLDVPKERFISYPGIRKENDPTPLVGWAGWNDLERTQALSSWYSAAADLGRPEEELVSLLAGLWELAPWLRQWHNEIDPQYGERLGDFFTAYTQTQTTALGRTTDNLTAWRPPTPTKKTRART